MANWLEPAAREAGEKMFSTDDIKDMRAMLDDPYVSNDNKQNMLYALSNMGAISDSEIDKYAGQIGANAGDIKDGGAAPLENIVHAKGSLVAGREQQRTGAAKKALDDSQKRLDEGNFKNSDEIIDQADVGLKIFDDFYPRYTKAGGQSNMGGGADAPGAGLDPQSLRAATKQFRGIDFTAFKTDADALTAASKSVNESNQQLATAWAGNMAEWKGSGATAAAQYKSKLDAGAATLIQALSNAPGTITQGIGTIEKQVTDFAKQVHNIYGDGKMAQLTPTDVDNLLQSKDQLPGVIQQLEQKIQELNNRSTFDKIVGGVLGFFIGGPIGAIAGVIGISFAENITEDNIEEETAKYKQALADTQTKLQQFTQDYATKANSVQQQASNTLQGVHQSYDAMLQGLGQGMDKDPFADVGSPSQGGSDSTSSSSSGGSGGGNGGSPGAGAGGGGTGAAAGGGGGTAAESTAPNDPAQVAQAAQQEAGHGINPLTGKPMETDPQTGQPYPIDPKTGEAIKDAGDDQDTVTVKKGDNTIEMSEPDKDGKMDIKIDDGAGHAKDYQLDWGDDDKSTADGAASDPGAGAAGAAGGAAGAGAAGGVGGAAGAAGGAAGDKVYTPGPDGKIHIDDGNLKITAERPDGPDGPTTVTVDDGSGTPTTYTLGEEDKGSAGGGSASDAAAGRVGDASGAGRSGDVSAAGHAGAAAGQAGGASASAGAAGQAGGAAGGDAAGSAGGAAGGDGAAGSAGGAAGGDGAAGSAGGAAVGDGPAGSAGGSEGGPGGFQAPGGVDVDGAFAAAGGAAGAEGATAAGGVDSSAAGGDAAGPQPTAPADAGTDAVAAGAAAGGAGGVAAGASLGEAGAMTGSLGDPSS
ncbi:MAG TPA: hypothetical protein VHC18_08830, partial [Amycolatopsis sp.]|nr:hypothetical protein [Amycolatopsis sp.]